MRQIPLHLEDEIPAKLCLLTGENFTLFRTSEAQPTRRLFSLERVLGTFLLQ